MHFGSFRVVSDIYMESDIGAMQRCLTAVCEVDPMCVTYRFMVWLPARSMHLKCPLQ